MREEDKFLREFLNRKRLEAVKREGSENKKESEGVFFVDEGPGDEDLRRLVEVKRPRKRKAGIELGGLVSQYIRNTVKVKERQAGPVVRAWQEVLPSGLQEVCRINKISGGVLEVFVRDAVFLYEMQMLKQELLKDLGQRCKRVKVKDIKFKLG